MISNKIKQRFVKDFNLPFSIVQEPYFSYFIKTHKAEKELSYLTNFLNEIKDEEEFFKKGEDLRKEIQEFLTSHKDFSKINDFKLIENIKFNNPSFNLYSKENQSKSFVSIDLVQANFQSMKFISKELVKNKEDFKGFIKEFTSTDYFIKSKRFRQIVFGEVKLNPKRQQRIQRMIIDQIIQELLQNHIISESTPLSLTSDEVIIPLDSINSDYLKVLNKYSLENNINLSIEEFSLNLVHPSYDFFIKTDLKTKDWELKNTPNTLKSEVIKYILSGFDQENYVQTLHPYDRIFYQDKRICAYLDYLFKE